MRGVLSGCLRAGSFEQGLAAPRAGSGVATASLQHPSVDVMQKDRATAQQ